METRDVTGLPASNDPDTGQKNNHLDSGHGSSEVKSLDLNEVNGEINSDMEEDMDLTEDDLRTVHGKSSGATVADQVSHVGTETVAVVDKKLDIQSERLIGSSALDVSSKSGVKRRRTASGEQQPTVHVTYNHLARASKQKLESLLKQWSEWEAEHNPSAQDQEEVLESGEATYFPALRIGLEKPSSVSFWIDDDTGNKLLKGFVPMENSTTPLYDRGFALGLTSADGSNNVEGGLEIMDDPPRCFNCGSYSHSLRECLKPFDRSAVNSARKQHKAKKNHTPGSRLPSRYYLSSQGGKYDGLKPGSLDAETRQLLGLGPLDPPLWLNRMRELGYPPGYLASEDDDPSGITIFGEEETTACVEETEDGEIMEKASPREPPKKMTVEFPGINAPIPENADERLWLPPSSKRDSHRSSERFRSSSRGYVHHEQHRSALQSHWDYRDEAPPGVEPSSYPPRYGSRYDYMSPRPRSPVFERWDYMSSRPRSPVYDRARSPEFERGGGKRHYYSSYDIDERGRDDRVRYGYSDRR